MLNVSKTELIILGGSVKPYDHERAGTKTVQFFDPRYVMFDILCFINVHCASLSCVFDVHLHCIPLCIFIVRPHCAFSLNNFQLTFYIFVLNLLCQVLVSFCVFIVGHFQKSQLSL